MATSPVKTLKYEIFMRLKKDYEILANVDYKNGI